MHKEVWVAAGQSNMEMPVAGFDYCPTDNFFETLVEANDDHGTYGHEEFICDYPSYDSMEITPEGIVIKLKGMTGGAYLYMGIEGFEIAGEDKVFHPAKAQFRFDGSLIINSEEVSSPVAVRYCFKNFQLGNYANRYGLPLLPFRTDDW